MFKLRDAVYPILLIFPRAMTIGFFKMFGFVDQIEQMKNTLKMAPKTKEVVDCQTKALLSQKIVSWLKNKAKIKTGDTCLKIFFI